MWRFLIIGLVVLTIVRNLIFTLEVHEQVQQLPRASSITSVVERQQVEGQVAEKEYEFSRAVSQMLREGRGLCILIAGLGGLLLWNIVRRTPLSRRDLLGVGLRVAVFGGLLGLWLWQTNPFLQSLSVLEIMGIPERPGTRVALLEWHLPVIASSWILLLLAVSLLLDWSLVAWGRLSGRPVASSTHRPDVPV